RHGFRRRPALHIQRCVRRAARRYHARCRDGRGFRHADRGGHLRGYRYSGRGFGMSTAQLPAFDLLVAPPWLLPQVVGNGIQYELTAGPKYWLGSGLTAGTNVLADTRASDAYDFAATELFGTDVPVITSAGL